MNAALWLMDRFRVPDALIGDLVERQRAGRSAAWLWRQAVAAIFEATRRSVLNQKGVALVTALVSAAGLFFWVESSWALYLWLSDKWINAWASPGATWVHGVRVGGFWNRGLFVWWELYGGGLSLLWCIGSALIGRLVARTQSMALVLVSVAAQLPFILWWGVPIWLRAAGYAGLPPARPLNLRVVAAVVLVGMPLSAIVAGLSAAQRGPFPCGRWRSTEHVSAWPQRAPHRVDETADHAADRSGDRQERAPSASSWRTCNWRSRGGCGIRSGCNAQPSSANLRDDKCIEKQVDPNDGRGMEHHDHGDTKDRPYLDRIGHSLCAPCDSNGGTPNGEQRN
jgi:hypothetical protein